jgi:hypothetical protein
MSFYVKPNDVFPTINLKPRGSDPLNPWLKSKGSATHPPRQDSETQMSGGEVLARLLLGAASGLEEARVRKISAACGNSILALAFAFSEEGPARGCRCLSRNIVRSESPALVTGIIYDLDAGRDFDDATDKLSEERFTAYLEGCVSGRNDESTVDKRAGQQSEPVLTLEQKAAAFFPDPVKPSYT